MWNIIFIVVATIIRNIYIFVFVEVYWADIIGFTTPENLKVLKGCTDKLRCDNDMFNWFSWLMNSSEAWTMVLLPGMKLIHLHNNEWMNITINTSFFLCLPSFVLYLFPLIPQTLLLPDSKQCTGSEGKHNLFLWLVIHCGLDRCWMGARFCHTVLSSSHLSKGWTWEGRSNEHAISNAW